MTQPAHIVAIFGGGIAGSEAALRLAERGIRSVVFEMEALPWGKIELGLPKWHVKQRNMEEDGIDFDFKLLAPPDGSIRHYAQGLELRIGKDQYVPLDAHTLPLYSHLDFRRYRLDIPFTRTSKAD